MSPYPPLGEFRTAPTETHIPSKSGVGYRVEATAPALLSDPTGWDTPSLGQFFGGKNLEEGADNGRVLCSDLCSSSFHGFAINELQCVAVLTTAIFSKRATHTFADGLGGSDLSIARAARGSWSVSSTKPHPIGGSSS